jgi:hypothetical protein
MFEIKIDTSRVEDKLDRMIDQIKFTAQNDIAVELVDWQRQDMQRLIPNVQQTDTTATTRFWSRIPRRKTSFVIIPQLRERLKERMRIMLKRELRWQ